MGGSREESKLLDCPTITLQCQVIEKCEIRNLKC